MAKTQEKHITLDEFRADSARWLDLVGKGYQVFVCRGKTVVAVLGRNGYRPNADDPKDPILPGAAGRPLDDSWLD